MTAAVTKPTATPVVWSTGPGAGPAALPLFGEAASEADHPRRAFVTQVMGLPLSVHVRGPAASGPDVEEAVESAFTSLRLDDELFSTWKPDSLISRVRRGEVALQDSGPLLLEVAELCDEARRRTRGAFSAWLPGRDGIPEFDPTGLVKGWAVQRAFHALTARLAAVGSHDLLISAGGDVVLGCARTDTPGWVVAVEDPRDRSRALLTLRMRAGAVATSGTAARGQHIINPESGRPAAGLLSATVVGPDMLWADVYATAAFVDGSESAAWWGPNTDFVGFLVNDDGTTATID